MAKRSLQQIEDSLRAQLKEVKLPGGGAEPKDYRPMDLGGGSGQFSASSLKPRYKPDPVTGTPRLIKPAGAIGKELSDWELAKLAAKVGAAGGGLMGLGGMAAALLMPAPDEKEKPVADKSKQQRPVKETVDQQRIKQIEETLRARLAEAGSKDIDNDGVPDEIQQRYAPGLNPYDPLNIGGRGTGGFNIDIGIGGTGRGGGGRPSVWRGSSGEKMAVPKPLQKPRVSPEEAKAAVAARKRAEELLTGQGFKGKESSLPPGQYVDKSGIRRNADGTPVPTVLQVKPSAGQSGPKFDPNKPPDTGLERRTGPGTREIWHNKPRKEPPPLKPEEQAARNRRSQQRLTPDVKDKRERRAGYASVGGHAAALAALLWAQKQKEKESGGSEPTGSSAASTDSAADQSRVTGKADSGPDSIELPKVDLPTGRYGLEPGQEYTPPADAPGTMGGSIIVEPKRKTVDIELVPLPREPKSRPEPRPEPDAEPRAQARIVRQPPVVVEPKAEPRVEPKLEPRVEPKAEPRVEPKAEPRVEPKAEPKVTTTKPEAGTKEKPGAGSSDREGPGTKTSPGGTGERPSEKSGPGTGPGRDKDFEPGRSGERLMRDIWEQNSQHATQLKLLERYRNFLIERQKLDSDQLNQLRQDPNVRKMLDLISRAEGADYDTIVGQLGPKAKKITDYSKHPQYIGLRTKHGPSDAAGRYQILSSTYRAQAKKLGITDFSPESQDKIAISILNDVGALDPVLKGDFKKAILRSNNQWVSLPGTKYEQGFGPRSWKWVDSTLKNIESSNALAAATGTLPATAQPVATNKSTPAEKPAKPGYYTVGDSHGQGIAVYGKGKDGPEWVNKSKVGASVVDKDQFKAHMANIESIPPGSVVTISGGANDIGRSNHRVIVDNLNKLITAAKAKGHKVVYVLPTESPDPAKKEQREALRQTILNGVKDVPIIDLGIASKTDKQQVHLDSKGYNRIAKNISDMFVPGADVGKTLSGKPVGTQVLPDWSKYKYGDQGVLVKNAQGEWATLDGKRTATDANLIADLEKLDSYTPPESFLDKVQRSLPPFLGGKGELVSQVFGDKKKSAAAPAAPAADQSDRDAFLSDFDRKMAAQALEQQKRQQQLDRDQELLRQLEKKSGIKSKAAPLSPEPAKIVPPKVEPAKATKVDPAYEPGTAEYDARMEKLQIAAGDKFSSERQARLDKEVKDRKSSETKASADVAALLQKDQVGLKKVKRELSDFEKAFAAARTRGDKEFTWQDKQGKPYQVAVKLKGETPAKSMVATPDLFSKSIPADQSLDKGEQLVDVPAVTDTGEIDRFNLPASEPSEPAPSEIQQALKNFEKEQEIQRNTEKEYQRVADVDLKESINTKSELHTILKLAGRIK